MVAGRIKGQFEWSLDIRSVHSLTLEGSLKSGTAVHACGCLYCAIPVKHAYNYRYFNNM